MRECYASALGDCEGRLSKEHYFSAGVLRQLFQTGEYKVGGFHWQRSGYQPPSIPSLSANILCEKHNRQLSPLDEEALRIVLYFDNHVSIVAQGLHHTKSVTEVRGELFERWILKALVGLMVSRNVFVGETRIEEWAPEREMLEVLFGLRLMQTERRHGLYLVIRPGAISLTERGLRFQHLFSDDRICGATCTIHGVRFGLLMGSYRSDSDDPLLHAEYKPAGVKLVNLSRPSCSAEMRLTWSTAGSRIGLEIPIGVAPSAS
ncbi:MAG: hypothetical protein ACLPTF_25360 [Steroidobacteraceae bacterium]